MISKTDKQFFRNKCVKLLIGGSPSKIFHLEEFANNPKKGEVYNLGGGASNSASVLEIINLKLQV